MNGPNYNSKGRLCNCSEWTVGAPRLARDWFSCVSCQRCVTYATCYTSSAVLEWTNSDLCDHARTPSHGPVMTMSISVECEKRGKWTWGRIQCGERKGNGESRTLKRSPECSSLSFLSPSPNMEQLLSSSKEFLLGSENELVKCSDEGAKLPCGRTFQVAILGTGE